MDLSFPTLYKKIEERYIDDDEFTPDIVYTLTENTYREELLKLFQLEVYSEEIIHTKVGELYSEMKESLADILQIVEEKYGLKWEMGFLLLFSYDHFYLFLPLLKKEKHSYENLLRYFEKMN